MLLVTLLAPPIGIVAWLMLRSWTAPDGSEQESADIANRPGWHE